MQTVIHFTEHGYLLIDIFCMALKLWVHIKLDILSTNLIDSLYELVHFFIAKKLYFKNWILMEPPGGSGALSDYLYCL